MYNKAREKAPVTLFVVSLYYDIVDLCDHFTHLFKSFFTGTGTMEQHFDK